MPVFYRPVIYVHLYDHDNNPVHVYDSYKFLQLRMEIGKPGYFQIIFDETERNFDKFNLDYRIKFIRKVGTESAGAKTIFKGLHRTKVEAIFSNGARQYTSFGRGYMDLLNRRVVAAYQNKPLQTQGGLEAGGLITEQPVGAAMWDLVYMHIGPGALTGYGRWADGYQSNFQLQARPTYGASYSGDFAQKNLLESLQTLSDWSFWESPLVEYWVSETSNGNFYFNLYENGIGKDRTIDNGVNSPILMSPMLDNITNAWFSYTRAEELNRIYTVGPTLEGQQDEGPQLRAVGISNDLDKQSGVDGSPWNIIEATRSGGALGSVPDLEKLGYAELSKNRVEPHVSLVPRNTDRVIFGVDYNLGDRITIINGADRYDVRIMAVEIMIGEDGKENVKLEFGDRNLSVSPSFLVLNPEAFDDEETQELASRAEAERLKIDVARLNNEVASLRQK